MIPARVETGIGAMAPEETLEIEGREEGAALGGMNNARLGTLIFLSAEAMLFAGFLGAFVVLRSGREAASVPSTGTPGGWISFGIGAIALFTLELARRNALGRMGRIAVRRGRALSLSVSLWGAIFALLAAAAWLVTTSDTILGWGGGNFHDLVLLSPMDGCRLFLHTLLALHLLFTLLLTGVGIWRVIRSSDDAAEYLLRGELLWWFALAVRIAFAAVGI